MTLGIAAVIVGALAAGLPAVDRADGLIATNASFSGPEQPRDHVDRNLVADRRLLIGDLSDEPTGEHLPFGIVPRVVIPNCLLTPYEVQEVPSRHDGEILFLGTPLEPEEKVDPRDLIKVEVGILVVAMKQGETTEGPHFTIPGRDKSPQYRPYKDLDPIEPNKVALVKETQFFRRLKTDTVVKEGQLLGMINPDLALDELGMAIADLDASQAKYQASVETKKEAITRLDRMEKLGPNVVAKEEIDGAKLTVERYRYEEIENLQGIVNARKKLTRAHTNLKQHEIRARISGVVKAIYKNTRGEAVKGLEKGADTVIVLQNPSMLKIDGKVDIQYARSLKAGMEVVVEPIQRESYELAFRGHLQEVTGVAVSKNKLIVSAGGENRVYIWDRALVNTAKGVLVNPAKTKTFVVACTPRDDAEHNYCLTGGEDGIGRLWDLDALTDKERIDNKPVREFRDGHHKPITCVAFGPKGKWCATGSDDYSICIWDVGSGKKLETLTGHRGKVTSVQFASENQLVSASADHSLLLWSLKDNGAADRFKKFEGRGGDVAVLGVNPNGKQVLFDQGKELLLLSLPDGQCTGSLQNASGAMTFSTMALFSPDGKLILTNGATDGRLQLWRTPTATSRGYEVSQLVWNSPATCGAFAPDGSFVVTGGKDSYLLVWPMPEKEMIEKQLKARIISVDASLEDSSGVLVHAEMANPNKLLYAGDKATLVLYPGTK
jgi:WD40 repeat protein